MRKRGKLKYREGMFRFYFNFSEPLEMREVFLGSFQGANATLCTIQKDNHNLNQHRQRLRFMNDIRLKINTRFVENFDNIYRILT